MYLKCIIRNYSIARKRGHWPASKDNLVTLPYLTLFDTRSASVGDDTTKPAAVNEWCGYDSGRRTLLSGYDDYDDTELGQYISVTRDGSVWLRVGTYDSQFDWSLVDVRRPRVQTPVITDDMLE